LSALTRRRRPAGLFKRAFGQALTEPGRCAGTQEARGALARSAVAAPAARLRAAQALTRR